MKKFFVLIAGIVLFLSESSVGQSFSDVSGLLGTPIVFNGRDYGSGISFYDFNKDGLDDITIPNVSESIIFLINNGNGFDRVELIPNEGKGKMVLWGDYDNDGDADLYITFNTGVNRMFRQDENFQFVDVTEQLGILKPAVQSYGASWGDINGDGFLDLLVCNYDEGPVGNWLFLNDQGESFSDVSVQYGVNIGSDFSFVGTFFDFNNDGKQDIHIANDRFPIDAMYVNQGEYFSNNAVSAGFDTFVNSMCSSLADFNHDGRLDLYVTNTMDGNFLWRRTTDPLYYDVAISLGVKVNRWCWGASWVDIDNDSWEDLFVNNHPNANDLQPFFMNQTGMFTQQNMVNQYANSWSSFASAKGDFNGDGYYDFAINCDENIPVKLLQNDGGSNHFVKVNLQGVISNSDGIGTLIEYTIGGVSNKRYVTSTTGYLTQDSQWMILGIGEATMIDELKLTWLSGQVDIYNDVPASSVLTLIEGFEEVNIQNLPENNEVHLCVGEVFTATIESNNFIVWNTGEEGGTQIFSEPGTYFATVTNSMGIVNYSDSLYIYVEDFPEYSLTVHPISCYGESDGFIEVFSIDPIDNIVENSNGEVLGYTDLAEGVYTFTAISEFGCLSSSPFQIEMPSPLETNFLYENISCFGLNDGSFTITSTEGGVGQLSTLLYQNEMEVLPENWWSLQPGDYTVSTFDESGCVNTQLFYISEPDPLILDLTGLNLEGWFEIDVSGGTPPYSISWNDDAVANGNAVVALAGENIAIATDDNNCSSVYNLNFVPAVIQSIDTVKSHESLTAYYAQGLIHLSNFVNTISIYDCRGGLVYKNETSNLSYSVDIASGIYFIVLNNNDQLVQLKLLIL